MHTIIIILVVMAALCNCADTISADTKVTITGTVYVATRDYPDEWIPGVNVTFTAPWTGESFTTVTGAEGDFTLNLPIPPVSVSSSAPHAFSLGCNYPNPFNPATTIEYELGEPSDTVLDVFNITGQRVATLVDCWMPEGLHSTCWNGCDDTGRPLSAGVYLYRLRAGAFTATRKMLLIDGSAAVTIRSNRSFPSATYAPTKTTDPLIAVYQVKLEKPGYETREKAWDFYDGQTHANLNMYQLDYFPLAVGNSWTYEQYYLEDPNRTIRGEVTNTITSTKTLKTKDYFVFDALPVSIKDRPHPHYYPEEVLVRKNMRGNILIWEGSFDVLVYYFFTTASKESMALRVLYPGLPLNPAAELSTYVVSVDDTVTVGDTVFYPCYQIGVSDGFPDSYQSLWFAPGIGAVRVYVSSVFPYCYDLKRATIDGKDYEF